MTIILSIVVAVLIGFIFYLAHPIAAKRLLANFIAIPIYLEFFLKFLAFTGIRKYNKRMLEQGRFTRHINLYYKMEEKCLSIIETLDTFLLSFMGETMSNTIKRKQDVVSYVPLAQRGSERPMTFQMASISRRQLAAYKDGIVTLNKRGQPEKVRASSVKFEITLARLVGWSGVCYEDGAMVPFNASEKEHLYDLLPTAIQEELESVFGDGDYTELTASSPALEQEDAQED